jgi:hypothetical protein
MLLLAEEMSTCMGTLAQAMQRSKAPADQSVACRIPLNAV